MELYQLLWVINDDEVVDLYDYTCGEKIATKNGDDDAFDEYMNCHVTDVFTDNGHIAIEIDREV